MLPALTLPNGRSTSALGFGCSSLLRLPDPADRQRLLATAVEYGICHFDVARLYGLGLAEAELAPLLRHHRGQLTLATKFGLGEAAPPSLSSRRQGGLRRLLRSLPALRPLARRLYGSRMVPRNFSTTHARRSLHTSLSQLGVESVDLLLLHEPTPADAIDPELEATLQELQQQGLIGGFGLSGLWPDCSALIQARPALAGRWLQWEDDLLEAAPALVSLPSGSPAGHGRFGRVRRSLQPIRQAFEAVPQLQPHWSERLNCSLDDGTVLAAALLGAALASDPGGLLLYATTDAERLARTLTLLHDPPWPAAEAIAFEAFWRPPASRPSSPGVAP
jgi:D-threo-aldose 1-dehydrogenase